MLYSLREVKAPIEDAMRTGKEQLIGDEIICTKPAVKSGGGEVVTDERP